MKVGELRKLLENVDDDFDVILRVGAYEDEDGDESVSWGGAFHAETEPWIDETNAENWVRDVFAIDACTEGRSEMKAKSAVRKKETVTDLGEKLTTYDFTLRVMCEALFSFSVFQREVEERIVKLCALTMSESRALRVLHALGVSASITDVGKECGVLQSAATVMIARLAHKGLVDRVQKEGGDKRVHVVVALSERGRRRLELLRFYEHAAYGYASRNLLPSQKIDLQNMLNTLTAGCTDFTVLDEKLAAATEKRMMDKRKDLL